MNWNWKSHVKMNSLKILAHMSIEYSAIGAWYIALEGNPNFWFYGIGTAIIVHLIVFTKLDFLHELHHHHNNNKGHSNHSSHD